jgi:hypothetical protein
MPILQVRNLNDNQAETEAWRTRLSNQRLGFVPTASEILAVDTKIKALKDPTTGAGVAPKILIDANYSFAKNFLAQSADLTSSSWTKTAGVTVYGSQADPSGKSQAFFIDFVTTNRSFYQYVPTNGYVGTITVNYSVYVQGQAGQTINLELHTADGSGTRLQSNTTAVTLTTTWTVITLPLTLTSASSTMTRFEVNINNTGAATAKSLYVAFPQLESGSSRTTYQSTYGSSMLKAWNLGAASGDGDLTGTGSSLATMVSTFSGTKKQIQFSAANSRYISTLFPSTQGSFTVCAYIKHNSANAETILGANGTGAPAFLVPAAADTLRFDNSFVGTLSTSSTNVSTSNYQFVALSYNHSTGAVSMRINNLTATATPSTVTAPTWSARSLFIGARTNTVPQDFFDNVMQNFMVFDTNLTNTQLDNIYTITKSDVGL